MVKPYPISKLIEEWVSWAEWAMSHRESDAENPFGVAFFELGWLVEHEPETAWNVILQIAALPSAQPCLGNLAAGPVEDLLSYHGSNFIDRIELQAASNPTFASLLGGVWQHTMSNEIWRRVQAACIAGPSGSAHVG